MVSPQLTKGLSAMEMSAEEHRKYHLSRAVRTAEVLLRENGSARTSEQTLLSAINAFNYNGSALDPNHVTITKTSWENESSQAVFRGYVNMEQQKAA